MNTPKEAPAVVTREHRMWAIACMEEWEYGMLTPDHVAWLDGAPTISDYNFEESLARAIADAEARGRAASSAEVTRLQAELSEAQAGLAQFAKDIEGLGVPDAPWPETLDAIKAAMRIELLKVPGSELHAIGAPPGEVIAICAAGYSAAVFAADWAVLTGEVRHLMPERLARIEAALSKRST